MPIIIVCKLDYYYTSQRGGFVEIGDILNLPVASNKNLLPCEKETTANINNEGLTVHSDHRTGIKWRVKQLQNDRAELKDYTINEQDDGNKLVGIVIKTDIRFISFKSKPRQGNNISNCFSI